MKILALLINIAAIPACLFSGMMVMMSPMMFDAPGSTELKPLWAALGFLLLLPIMLLLGLILGWKRYSAGNYKGAMLAYVWAVVNVGLLVLCFAFL